MTNLTEKWKKGELTDGKYWVMLDVYGDGEPELSDVQISDGSPIGWCNESIKEVLAEVPSYEEWKDIKDDLATCDKDLNNVCEQKEELYEENTELKELLKECKRYIDIWGYTDTHGNALLPQINQVLGEE